MKIALYDPAPRVCGPTSGLAPLKAGFQQLGHEVDLLSFTKSGKPSVAWGAEKPGARWWAHGVDRCEKLELANMVRVLDGYDFVILPEIKVPMHDKDALKATTTPHYVQALLHTKTRWTTFLHGSFYPQKDIPFVEQLLESPSRARVLCTYSMASVESNPIFDNYEWKLVPGAYTPVFDMDTIPPRDPNTVGATGRFIYNKGQHLVCFAGMYLPPEVIVEVWGACSIGPSASPTYVVYEAMQKLDPEAQKVRYGKVQPGANPEGNVIQPFSWDFRFKDHALVRYLGNYSMPAQTSARLAVHAALTSSNFAGGIVERGTLEAMDAGCLCITAPHISEYPTYRTLVLDKYDVAPSVPKAVKNLDTVKYVADAMMHCLELWRSNPTAALDIVRHNRNALRTINGPAAVAQQILEAAFS